MATLQKIRNHGVLLLVIVGLAMLAFILGDFLNSGSSFFNRSREYVGVIAGTKVHYTDYEAAKDQLTEVYKIESGRSNFDEETTTQIRNQVWQMMLMDYSLQAQTKEIGMTVTPDELSELCIGEHPHQLISSRRTFFDENGQFSRDLLVNFLHQIEQEGEDDAQNANLQQARTYWMYWENAVRLTQLQEKYTDLVKHLVTANKLDAKYAFEGQKVSANVQYVMQPYTVVADSLVTVTTRDIKRLYNDQKAKYKQNPSRSIEYITFDVQPSEQDFQAAEELMKSLEEEFRTTDDVALVVNTNSDLMYDGRNYSEQTVPEQYKEFAFGKDAKKDAFAEMTFADNTYSMARIIECGYTRPDSVQLKVIAQEEGQEDTELGWFTEEQLGRDMAEKAFTGKKGEQFTMAAGLGEQTFEIMDVAKATPRVKLAILQREVTPSSKTISARYNEAKQFIVTNRSEDMFRSAVAEMHMTLYPAYNLDKNADKVSDLKQSRPIVRWAYEAKEEGTISDVFECGDKFVVALLTSIDEDEYRPLADVEVELRRQATNEKKAEYLKEQVKGLTTLQDIAAKWNTTVQTANGVTLSGYQFGNMGPEYKAMGKAVTIEENKLSDVIAGNQGAIVLMTTSRTKAEGEMNAETEIAQLNQRRAYMLPYQIINLLEQNSEVEDNRSNFQ